MNQYFLYARKSTDVEDKQVLSIEAQLAELRNYAKVEGLSIIEEIVEKQSAKSPGRPMFNDMIARLERGEGNGIVSWNPFVLPGTQSMAEKLSISSILGVLWR